MKSLEENEGREMLMRALNNYMQIKENSDPTIINL